MTCCLGDAEHIRDAAVLNEMDTHAMQLSD